MAESPAQKLKTRATEAAEVRAYQTHPDVVALQVERIRLVVDRMVWGAVILGLAFTAANVQHFAAQGAEAWSLPWTIAWLLDPMVSLVVVGILLAESITSRWQVKTGFWVRVAKWGCLGATYVMNTWASWAEVLGSRGAHGWAQVVLHSVPPLVVLIAAEAITDLRDRLTEAVLVAARRATEAAAAAVEPVSGEPQTATVPLTAPAAERPTVSPAADDERPAPLTAEPERSPLTTADPEPVAPLTGPAAPTPAHAPPAPEAAIAEADEFRVLAAVRRELEQLRANGHDVDAGDVPAGAGPRPLHLVTPPTPHTPHTSPTPRDPSAQVDGDETTDETTGETGSEALMRDWWEREVTAGRVPTGAELARVGQVSPATGKRRRAAWEAELPEQLRGGAVHVASA